nr:ribonuclease H-like domain, reverse transcriptase, RNA-dependent DNA polymerase [Tanacetum cinerariifolium]
MVAYLTKSDASEGFNQVIDFLNGSYIKYALTINPKIYMSCIKRFWSTVAIKQDNDVTRLQALVDKKKVVVTKAAIREVNDVTRLQALVDKKKVVVTEAAIREVLGLDDAEGVDCLPNKEIFTELSRMGYEKPSTKLTFYKAFFSNQWKFLIHTILLSMSAKRTSWNEFSSAMASTVICLSTGRKFNFSKYIFDSLVRNVDSTTKFYMYPRFLQLLIRKQVGDLSTHTTKYASPTLTQKVFVNIRRVRKEFFRVETPLFEGMLIRQEIKEEGDADEHVEDVTACDDAQGDDTAAHGEVQQTPPESPQVQPPSPQPQPQQQAVDFPMSLLQEAINACATLTRRVKHLEYDKVAQALEITKLKRRVKKLEKGNKARVLKLRRLQKVGTSQRVDTSKDTVMDDKSNQGRMIDKMDKDDVVVLMDEKEEDKKVEEAKVEESAQVQGRQAESQAEIYKINVDHASKVLITAASVIISAAEPQLHAAIITAALLKVTDAPSRRRKGAKCPSLSRRSNRLRWMKNMLESCMPSSTKIFDWDVAINHVKLKAKEDPAVQRYQVMKRKPQTEAQAQKNIMMYLKNVASFKLDYFKGMSYDDIRPIFEAKFNSNIAFLLKTKEQMEEEENKALQTINKTPAQKAAKRRKLNKEVKDLKRHLEIMPNEDDDVYTEATPLARKVPIMDYEIIELNNKPYYKIIKADGTHKLYISFLTLLKNFNREDLEALWSLVKESFGVDAAEDFKKNMLRNFTYVVDLMIIEDISSIIDPRLLQVVLGKPFVEISNMTHDPPEGVVRFTNENNEVAYKMPHKIEQYNPLSNLEKEQTKSVYLMNEEDKRRGVEYVMSKILGFYKKCLELRPEYLIGIDDEGEIT